MNLFFSPLKKCILVKNTVMRNWFFLFFIFFNIGALVAQEEAWFYLRAKDTLIEPEFKKVGEEIVYVGKDQKLKDVLQKYSVYKFKKTYKKAKKENLKKTFFVMANQEELMQDLLDNVSHLFVFGELIAEEDKKIFEPNDFGLTSTIGDNIGLPVNLDYFDVLGVPKAWYYTTGSPDVIIGISDGIVDTTNIDFKDKTKIYNKSHVAKGHGYSIAANAAAQGDNGYGVTGVCYDCGIYSTNYGDFRNLSMVMELSRAGVKVVNCSWIGTKYYETAQAAVDEMFENGTIIVAAGGNKDWSKTQGELFYYPATYDHVISVSVGMYKHENILDNILQEENSNYYAENIWGHVGRTMGFKNNDTLSTAKIWPVSTSILNTGIDILAPSTGIFMFANYILEDEIAYHKYTTTSGATPLVSGTIGLMFSLYPCLPVEEVESILKISSSNIDHIEANKPYAGKYGAGLLNTGNAIELLYKLYSEDEVAYIENQIFSRWDFTISSVSEKVILRNQEFKGDATLDLSAKNRIVIGQNTVLRPNENGKIHLKITPDLEKQCDLRLREKID